MSRSTFHRVSNALLCSWGASSYFAALFSIMFFWMETTLLSFIHPVGSSNAMDLIMEF